MSEDAFCYSNWGWGAVEAKDAAKLPATHQVLSATNVCSSELPEHYSLHFRKCALHTSLG